jgi:hypothetical protein
MVGPATNLAGIVTTSRIIGRKSTFFYLISVIISAFAFGMILNQIGLQLNISSSLAEHCDEYPWWQNLSAILVILISAYSICMNFFNKIRGVPDGSGEGHIGETSKP